MEDSERNSLNIAQPNCRYLATRGSQRRRVAASEGGLEIAYSTLLEAAWQFRSNRSTSSATRTFALLLWKYGRSELVNPVWLDDLLGDAEDRPTMEAPPAVDELAQDVEALGPTFVKLGQLLSTRPDIIPPAYATALSRLQDRCEPFPFAQVEEILTEELGVRLSKAFSHFEARSHWLRRRLRRSTRRSCAMGATSR